MKAGASSKSSSQKKPLPVIPKSAPAKRDYKLMAGLLQSGARKK